jgi:hypothetical protein
VSVSAFGGFSVTHYYMSQTWCAMEDSLILLLRFLGRGGFLFLPNMSSTKLFPQRFSQPLTNREKKSYTIHHPSLHPKQEGSSLYSLPTTLLPPTTTIPPTSSRRTRCNPTPSCHHPPPLPSLTHPSFLTT